MAINKVILPYPDFKIGDVIDSEEFDANNKAIVDVINEIVESTNILENDDGDDIFLPTYIQETKIGAIDIESPTFIGNTLIGSTGMVGMTSIGTSNESVRIWAGHQDKLLAPFKVLQSGEVIMKKFQIAIGDVSSSGITSDIVDGKSVVVWAGGNKSTAPFRVTHGGSVFMNDATIETKADMNGSVKLVGGVIKGGILEYGESFYIGRTHTRSGTIVLNEYINSTSTIVSNFLSIEPSQITSSSPVFSIWSGSGEVLLGPKVKVDGNLYLTGDIYVNGVKMQLTPA